MAENSKTAFLRFSSGTDARAKGMSLEQVAASMPREDIEMWLEAFKDRPIYHERSVLMAALLSRPNEEESLLLFRCD